MIKIVVGGDYFDFETLSGEEDGRVVGRFCRDFVDLSSVGFGSEDYYL